MLLAAESVLDEESIPSDVRRIRSLISAIIERAIFDYFGSDERIAEAAECWLFTDADDENTEWSFAWTCNELSFDLERIRAKITSMAPRKTCRQGKIHMTWRRHRVTRFQPVVSV